MKSFYHLATICLASSLLPGFALAQGVGIGTTTPDPAAALDITATGKGLLIPRLDSATRTAIASPPAGLMVYQTSPRAGFYYYTGAAWVFIPDKARAGDNLGNHLATQNLNLQGNALVGTGADLGSTVGVGVRADGGLNIGQNTPSRNIFLGYLSGAVTTSGGSNTFLGYESGQRNTTGGANTFTGYYSGNSNTSGYQNTFTGTGSGFANFDGAFNVYTGSGSGRNNASGSHNTFQGYYSGSSAYGGSNDTFIGYASGDNLAPGNNNTYLGAQSGQGNNNSTVTAIGYQSGQYASNLTNATAVGANVSLGQSNTVILGNNASVGIGTSTPTALLDVAGSTRLRGLTTAGFVATDANGNLSSTATVPGDNLGNGVATTNVNLAGNLLVGGSTSAPGTTGVYVASSGSVGIGTTTPAATLDVVGTIRSTAVLSNAAGSLSSFGPSDTGQYYKAGGATQFVAAGADRMLLDYTGNLGIGTTAPATKLDVQGNLRLAVRLCPVNQAAYTLTAADIAYSVFKLQNGNFVNTLTLPDASAAQVEGQTLTIISIATSGFTISGTNTDGAVAMGGVNNSSVHSVTFTWIVDGSGSAANRWVRTQ